MLVQRDDARVASRRPLRELLVKLHRQPLHLIRRLAQRDAPLQAPDDRVVVVLASVLGPVVFAQHERHKDVCGAIAPDGIHESGGQHADDLPYLLIEIDRPADDILDPAEPALPEAVGEERHAMASFNLVVHGKCAAEKRRHSEHGKELPRNLLRPRIRRLAALGLQAEARAARCGERLERLLVSTPVQIRLWRHDARAERHLAPDVLLEYDRKSVVLVQRQTSQHHSINHGKDCGSRTDPEGEHDEGNSGKGRRCAQRADGVPQVVTHGPLDGKRTRHVGYFRSTDSRAAWVVR